MSREQHEGFPGFRRHRISGARREALRTTLWVVPALMVGVAILVFTATSLLDRAVHDGRLTLPAWMNAGGADAGRAVLIGIAAAVITVAGVVFSITILALQLASQQFGPRMLRNFIRDVGTQASLGAFVATFVYSILVLASVSNHGPQTFVPHIGITVALASMLADLAVLIYFIHHVATSIQLTSVVAGIARDFRTTLDALHEEATASRLAPATGTGPSVPPVMLGLHREGAPVPAQRSGFLQAVGHDRLVRIAASSDAVIRLLVRPGQFVIEGQLLAEVWPAEAADRVSAAMERAHLVGPNRTLTQDLALAVDQLVEVAIRALSPAINDTYTALNCVDWLGDCLSHVARRPLPEGVYRDGSGAVRVLDQTMGFDRLLKRATDKIRQSGASNPAVLIRQLENLGKIALTARLGGSATIARHGDLIMRTAERSVPEPSDVQDVRDAYDELLLAVPGEPRPGAEESDGADANEPSARDPDAGATEGSSG